MAFNLKYYLDFLYNNPAISVIVFIAVILLIGYLIKKMKTLIIIALLLMFILGFYIYNQKSVGIFTKDGIKKVKDIDAKDIKNKSENVKDTTRSKFFDTFKDI